MVLVSHAHNFVFLKTAKTAGTSIEMFLEALCNGDTLAVSERTHARETENFSIGMRMVPRKERIELDDIWHNHMPAADVRALIGEAKWQSALKITSVRNPFDLVVSRFHWQAEKKRHAPLAPDRETHRAAFSRFVAERAWPTSEEVVHIDGVFVAERLIRYEHLQSDLKSLCADLNVTFNPALLTVTKPTQDRRSGFTLSDYYTKHTEAIVLDRHRWMFEAGNYASSVADIPPT